RVAGIGHLDGLAREPHGLAVEIERGHQGRLVARAAAAPGGIAGLPLDPGPPARAILRFLGALRYDIGHLVCQTVSLLRVSSRIVVGIISHNYGFFSVGNRKPLAGIGHSRAIRESPNDLSFS